ncbi:RNA polymerase factor sigma-54 [Jeotgalibaca arthritidis]|uniref:RNA polymerase factor sigma-54 n=1 Tax=Jeotgalibaca arthritidis TaxID=1868794 RepID=UPI0035A190AE
MEFNQHYTQKQTQKQQFIPNLVQGMEMLQLNRMELDTYLNRVMLGNPFIDMNLADPLKISSKKLSHNDLSHIIEQTSVYEASLHDFLHEQIYLLYCDTPLRQLMFWWVDQLDERGYVTKNLDEAMAETRASQIELLDSLTLLQQLDPAGIGARSVQECLMIQTERMDFAPEIAYLVLEEHYDELIQKKWSVIAEDYGVSLSDIEDVYSFIQRLSLSPAEHYESRSKATPYIIPELMVDLNDGQLVVAETRYKTPLLTLNVAYLDEMKAVDDKEVQTYVRTKKQEFDQLQASLMKRKDTILKVGTAILMHQQDFFLDPNNHLKPLQLNDLAQLCQLSESTISRTVRDTFVQTPRGVFELRSFLSRRMEGFDQSKDEVMEHVKQLIADEDKHKPLSDQKLEHLLKEKGMTVSRRAIANYRKQLQIPSSTDRKIK